MPAAKGNLIDTLSIINGDLSIPDFAVRVVYQLKYCMS